MTTVASLWILHSGQFRHTRTLQLCAALIKISATVFKSCGRMEGYGSRKDIARDYKTSLCQKHANEASSS